MQQSNQQNMNQPGINQQGMNQQNVGQYGQMPVMGFPSILTYQQQMGQIHQQNRQVTPRLGQYFQGYPGQQSSPQQQGTQLHNQQGNMFGNQVYKMQMMPGVMNMQQQPTGNVQKSTNKGLPSGKNSKGSSVNDAHSKGRMKQKYQTQTNPIKNLDPQASSSIVNQQIISQNQNKSQPAQPIMGQSSPLSNMNVPGKFSPVQPQTNYTMSIQDRMNSITNEQSDIIYDLFDCHGSKTDKMNSFLSKINQLQPEHLQRLYKIIEDSKKNESLLTHIRTNAVPVIFNSTDNKQVFKLVQLNSTIELSQSQPDCYALLTVFSFDDSPKARLNLKVNNRVISPCTYGDDKDHYLIDPSHGTTIDISSLNRKPLTWVVYQFVTKKKYGDIFKNLSERYGIRDLCKTRTCSRDCCFDVSYAIKIAMESTPHCPRCDSVIVLNDLVPIKPMMDSESRFGYGINSTTESVQSSGNLHSIKHDSQYKDLNWNDTSRTMRDDPSQSLKNPPYDISNKAVNSHLVELVVENGYQVVLKGKWLNTLQECKIDPNDVRELDSIIPSSFSAFYNSIEGLEK